MSKKTLWIVGIVALQAFFVATFLLVESGRLAPDEPSSELAVSPPDEVPMPPLGLELRRRDGTIRTLDAPARQTMVHVWATWCPPCLRELPSVLALAEREDFELVVVSVDPTWEAIDGFRDDLDRPFVYLADSDAVERALDVRHLPVTFVLKSNGEALRFDGRREWSDEFVSRWTSD